jgi:Helix-turn-helix domain
MRMRQEPDAGDGGNFPPRVYMGADGSDASAWRDEQLGQIFRSMRLTMKVSRETIARRLATTPACVDNFEAGAVSALPHGKETDRIVRGYCELLRVDPEPVLWRIRSHMQALASHPGPAGAMRPAGFPVQATADRGAPRSQPVVKTERTKGERTKARPARPRRGARALFVLSAPVALLAGMVYLAHAVPRPVYRAIALLPPPVDNVARAGWDYLVHLTAPHREGLRWIEVSDPRMRKADKLQTSTR